MLTSTYLPSIHSAFPDIVKEHKTVKIYLFEVYRFVIHTPYLLGRTSPEEIDFLWHTQLYDEN